MAELGLHQWDQRWREGWPLIQPPVNENRYRGPIGCLTGGPPQATAGPTNAYPQLPAVRPLARFIPFRLPKKLTLGSLAVISKSYSRVQHLLCSPLYCIMHCYARVGGSVAAGVQSAAS